MNVSPAQRDRLLAHLAGPQPVDHQHLNSLRILARHGLVVLLPKGSARPQTSRLTLKGRAEAEALAVAELQAAE